LHYKQIIDKDWLKYYKELSRNHTQEEIDINTESDLNVDFINLKELDEIMKSSKSRNRQ
jgi:hypothetical protein